MRGLIRRFCRDVRGGALVEAAVVMPLAIGLAGGVAEFGRLYMSYDTLEKSVRGATRYLARVPASALCSGWGLTNAQDLVVYGRTGVNRQSPPAALVPGLTVANVTLASPTSCATMTEPVIVRINVTAPYTGIMLTAVPGLSNAITLRVSHEERWIGE
ncbi:TadE/TadG family type IV pilus assembly protein [Alsobacter sp. R-9]